VTGAGAGDGSSGSGGGEPPPGYLGADARIHRGPAPELVEAGYELELADTPLLWRGLGLADLAHTLVLRAIPDADRRALLTALLEQAGGSPKVWAHGELPGAVALAGSLGLRRFRALWKMRRPLTGQPIPHEDPPPGVRLRTFEVGRDEDAWLRANARAFAGHPEQGGWVEDTLRRRIAERWFDPKGFLLAFDADGLAGFCWTKVHPPTANDPELGEIFVIGVDPSRKGLGLGRPLVVGGLASLADRGVRTGMLFVDAANEKAVGLYASLGFTTARVDRAYEREINPS
jgi:mycothiol synthase